MKIFVQLGNKEFPVTETMFNHQLYEEILPQIGIDPIPVYEQKDLKDIKPGDIFIFFTVNWILKLDRQIKRIFASWGTLYGINFEGPQLWDVRDKYVAQWSENIDGVIGQTKWLSCMATKHWKLQPERTALIWPTIYDLDISEKSDYLLVSANCIHDHDFIQMDEWLETIQNEFNDMPIHLARSDWMLMGGKYIGNQDQQWHIDLTRNIWAKINRLTLIPRCNKEKHTEIIARAKIYLHWAIANCGHISVAEAIINQVPVVLWGLPLLEWLDINDVIYLGEKIPPCKEDIVEGVRMALSTDKNTLIKRAKKYKKFFSQKDQLDNLKKMLEYVEQHRVHKRFSSLPQQ